MSEVNIHTTIQGLNEGLNASISSLTQSLNAEVSASIIYAISPLAKVEELPDGKVLITITDKNGTTTSEINNVNQETINNFIQDYFQKNKDQLKNYEKLNNLPSIEGIPLIGNKTFTQLQMSKLTNADIELLLQ